MEYTTIALPAVFIAGIFCLLLLFIYKRFGNPTVVHKLTLDNMAKCPDRWNHDPITNKCVPGYKTGCLPFNPDDSKLDTISARCNVARSCETYWSGFCK